MSSLAHRCPGCEATLPDLQSRFVGAASFNLWAREGYCSFPCFRDQAPSDLVERHERIESGRFDRDLQAASLPRKRHKARPREELAIASVFRRIGARLLDAIVPRAIVVLVLASWLASKIHPQATIGDVFVVLFSDGASIAKLVFGLLLGGILYYTVCTRLGGQTPAKTLARLRVVTEGGRPAKGVRCFARESLAIFDVLLLGVVGFVCMSMTKARQRLGDMIARTVVIRDERPVLPNLGRSLALAAASIAIWVGLMMLLWL